MNGRRVIIYLSFGFVLFFFLSISLGMFLMPKGRAIYYIALSQKLFEQGDTERAIEQAKKAVELQPNYVITVRWLARSYVRAGKYDDEVEDVVNKLIELSPNQAEAYNFLATVRFHRHDNAGAREAAHKSIELDPNLALNYYLLGAMALDEKDADAAERHLNKAIELNPNAPDANYLLGLIHYEREEYIKAVEELEKATKAAPDNAHAHAALAMGYFAQELYIHALTELKIAVDIDPADYNSMYNIACVYSIQNKLTPALKWLERAIDNGFSDFEHMGKDSDLDNIRNTPEYKILIEEATAVVAPAVVDPDSDIN